MNDENTNLNSGDNSEINPPEPENTDKVLSVSSNASPQCNSENMEQPFSPEATDNCISNVNDQITSDTEPLQPVSDLPIKTHKNKMNIFTAIMLSLIFILSAALSVYCIFSDIKHMDYNTLIEPEQEKKQIVLNSENKPPEAEIEYLAENGQYTTEGIAKYIRPQIVEIYVYKKPDLLTPAGSGSGIIITNDGYIVTNTHVIDNADTLIVTTSDNVVYNAEIIGKDAKTDIAVIKIDAENLPAAVLGNSDEAETGEKVVAIGNPAGLSGSVSDGIISGVNRKIRTDASGYEMTCIQTNAAISAGNSGGALVNMYGQVIGITSSKYIDYINLSYEGLGFAITINEAKPIIEELITIGYISGRVRVGITFFSANEYTEAFFKEIFKFDMPEELKKSLLITEISDDCDISNT
ncbi:MAG: trypsin-like peptidase domain-containing protein, partial [Oscillospiraceae bacterium]|nr:trypsin-like peptidase domain-containing protein [Oscillospiraceae bacterium]